MKFYDRAIGLIASLSLIRKYPVARQFIKFGIVGVSNLLVDFTVYIALTRGTDFFDRHFLLANASAFGVAVTWSYTINRRWTFRNTHRAVFRQYLAFLVINIIALGFNQLLLYGFVVYLGLYDLLAKFVAACTVIFWNFFANRYWTFQAHGVPRLTQEKNPQQPLVE